MIIGISGKAGSGKDTLASFIKEFTNCNIVHFADPLKESVRVMANLSHNDVYTQEGKKHTIDWLNDMTVRELLQKVGTAIRNEVDPDFWVKRLIQEIDNSSLTIIPDVRFLNEVNAIKDAGGIVIRIERNGINTGAHISETALDNYNNWNMVIFNDYSLETLKEQAKNIIKLWRLD